MKKINNYCFKCESTELLLLGGSDIFCSNCHLVFQDSETMNFLRWERPKIIVSKYQKNTNNLSSKETLIPEGCYNFDNFLEVLYGWLVRFNLLFKVKFYIDINFEKYDEDFTEKTIVKTETSSEKLFDEVIPYLKQKTSKNYYRGNYFVNREIFEFIDVGLKNNKWENHNLDFEIYCKYGFNNKKYSIVNLSISEDNYKNDNLYFTDWELNTVSDVFSGSFSELQNEN